MKTFMQRDNNDYLLSGNKLGIMQNKGEGKQAESEKKTFRPSTQTSNEAAQL